MDFVLQISYSLPRQCLKHDQVSYYIPEVHEEFLIKMVKHSILREKLNGTKIPYQREHKDLLSETESICKILKLILTTKYKQQHLKYMSDANLCKN